MLSQRIVFGAISGAAALFIGSASFAQEACPCGGGTRVTTAAALVTLLGNKTVCAAVGNDTWQEFHSGASTAGGQLVDYKRGPGDPVDPSAVVGTWAINSEVTQRTGATVNYNYGSGGSYAFSVCDAQGTVNFCSSARNITGATLRAGQVSCGAVATRSR